MKWTFNGHDAAFDGDGYLHFEKMNPYLPTVGFGFNPSLRNFNESAYRPEDSILANDLGFAGSQDRSLVLGWNNLPAMGAAKITYLNFAVGHDNKPIGDRDAMNGRDERDGRDEYHRDPGVNDNSRSMVFTLGLRPLGAIKSMGGIDMSSFEYGFAYENTRNGYQGGTATIGTVHATRRVRLANLGEAIGDHTFVGHGLHWSPFKPFSLAAHFIDWKADAAVDEDYNDNRGGPADDLHATEWRVVVRVWLWGPKSGMMGGSVAEGGIATSPMYSVIDLKDTGTTEGAADPIGEVKNLGWQVHYYVPGGWFRVYATWDRYECDAQVCHGDVALVSENGRSFSTVNLVAEYRF